MGPNSRPLRIAPVFPREYSLMNRPESNAAAASPAALRQAGFAALEGNYRRAMAACLTARLPILLAGLVPALVLLPYLVSIVLELALDGYTIGTARLSSLTGALWTFLALLAGLILLVTLLLSNPLQVGRCFWFSQNRISRSSPSANAVLGCFWNGRFLRVVRTMALRTALVWLGLLLLIVPGALLFYRYRLVPWILADQPGLPARRALALSRAMTDGNKGRMLALDLSLLGWRLLGWITLGLGFLFVRPILCAAWAEQYAVLRRRAVAAGVCTEQELGITHVPRAFR